MLTLTQPLNYGGRLYAIGEDVRGKLPLDMIQQLQEGGHIQEQESDGSAGEGEEKSTLDDSAKDVKSSRSQKNG